MGKDSAIICIYSKGVWVEAKAINGVFSPRASDAYSYDSVSQIRPQTLIQADQKKTHLG